MNRVFGISKTDWPSAAFWVVTLLILLQFSSTLIRVHFAGGVNPYLWPVLGISALILLTAGRVLGLVLNNRVDRKRLLRYLTVLSCLAGAVLFIGIFGYVMQLYRAPATTLHSGFFSAITSVVDGDAQLFLCAVGNVRECAILAMVCIFTAVMTLLICGALVTRSNYSLINKVD